MKKYIIFVLSFTLLFLLLNLSVELLSGIFLTSAYTPDIHEAWHASAGSPKKVEIFKGESSFLLTLLPALLSATAAYFITQKIPNEF